MARGLIWLAGIAVVAMVLLVGVAPPFAQRALLDDMRKPVDRTPAELGIEYKTLSFPARGDPLAIHAWWMPAARPKAALLLVHGGSSNRAFGTMLWLELAGELVARGYSVLAPDMRNHGESDSSDGGLLDFGDAESADLIGAVDHLIAREPLLRFGALGCSMGGQTVLYAAARDPRLEAVVADSTYAVVEEILPRFVVASTGLPALLVRPVTWGMVNLHGLPVDGGRAIDVIDAVAPTPVRLIHSAADPIVPAEHARRLAARGADVEVWIQAAPDASHPALRDRGGHGTHCYPYRIEPEAYVARVVGFFDEVFAAPGG